MSELMSVNANAGRSGIVGMGQLIGKYIVVPVCFLALAGCDALVNKPAIPGQQNSTNTSSSNGENPVGTPQGRQAKAKIGYPPNPSGPDSAWSEGHGSYCQQSTDLPSLTEDDDIVVDIARFDPLHIGVLPTGTMFTAPYPDGRYAFWGSQGRAIYKAVVSPTGLQLRYAPARTAIVASHGYWVMTRDNTVYVPDILANRIYVLRDADPTRADSDIELVQVGALPEGLLTAPFPNDYIAGSKMMYSGEIMYFTRGGVVALLDRDLQLVSMLRLENETLSNNPCVDGDNNIYVTGNQGIHKIKWDGKKLTEIWRVGITDSGSTPTLMGGPEDDERFVVVTTGGGAGGLANFGSQLFGAEASDRQSELLMVWRDEIPADWAGLPGEDRRIAARYPITFDAEPGSGTTEPTQNSVLVNGNDMILATWSGVFPLDDLLFQPRPGVEKVAWNPRTRRIERQWLNKEVTLPNAMQAMSTASNRMYSYALRSSTVGGPLNQWGLVIMDWSTGEVKKFVPTGQRLDLTLNTYGSGIQIAEDGGIVTMGPMGSVIRFRRATSN